MTAPGGLAACAGLVERGDPDRFRAAMAAPLAARARLIPLYALNLELARAPWASAEPMLAEMRLQWWRDALDEIGQGATPRGHEVLAPAAEVIRAAGIPVALFDAMAEARRWDIWREPFAGEAALWDHLDATAGNLMWAAALALEAPMGAEPAVRRFARGAGLAAWLRAVPALAARGRHPLPDPGDAGALARAGLADIAAARAARATVPRRAVPALWAGWQARAILAQAAAEPGRVAAGTLGLSEFAQRGGLLWRAFAGRW
ncbi:squalene/phytoene synthase family protein [Ruixingdingia sedimenti]|uniref:Squalene/phytoene synthase family protein n=1 Tax=Ruixingdingia sedimenti TaxID=3073604 RepID=A0ABU1F4L9_9RHOB|nr:squalene/phytoene synthase family protein [Xinfangfangia sp. LG-4]MDR5651821.1 squalene/phytoene synthase family protein [Xinfangfangia sp. LG-4]